MNAFAPSQYRSYLSTKPMVWWHESIIDWMLANPGKTKKDCALYFKRSVEYIYLVTNTDMFKARLAQRRAESNEAFTHSVHGKMLSTLDLALEVVKEQLETKRGQIPFKDTSAFVNSTLEKLGYGAPRGAQVQVNVGAPQAAVSINAADLAEARELLRRSEAAKLIEAKPLAPQGAPEAPQLPAESRDVDAA